MHRRSIYCAGRTAALEHARGILLSHSMPVTNKPDWNTGHLLLDVPSFRDSLTLRTGGNIDTLLSSLPQDTVIWGGNLHSPLVEEYRTVDLLKDEFYLTENAAITADCAIQMATPLLSSNWQDTSVLIIGWGRIGKCLAQLLKALGSDVTVAARSPSDRAALEALGYLAVTTDFADEDFSSRHILFNTVPYCMLDANSSDRAKHCIKIDLASQKGIEGENVIWARGLPGIHAPEASGRLIAKTVMRIWKEMEL